MNAQRHPITLAIDAVGAKHSGAATILTSVVRAALEFNEIGKIVLFLSPQSVRRFSLPESPVISIEERAKEEFSPLARIIWFERGLAQAVTRHNADVLLTLSAGGRPPPGIPAVAYLHNTLPFVSDSLARGSLAMRLRLAVLKQTIVRSIASSELVVVQSKSVRNTILSSVRVDSQKLRVIPPSAPVLPPLPKELPETIRVITATPRGYRLLCVTSDAAHKNVGVAVEAVKRLNASGSPLKLFLTFPKPQKTPDANVVYLGNLGADELSAAYHNADCLLMPSLAETVGLPLLEAMAVGLPIVAADRPYAHEVTDGNAEFFDPHNVSTLVDAIQRVLAGNVEIVERVKYGLEHIKTLEAQSPYVKLIELLIDSVLVFKNSRTPKRGGYRRWL